VTSPAPAEVRAAEYRYAAVLLLTFALVVFVIVAPSADWSRAAAIALLGGALVIVVATSRERHQVRRARALTISVVGAAVVAGVAEGVIPAAIQSAVAGALSLALPLVLVGGLVRLVRERGVTLQAVAGALTIYLLIGLMFAWLIGFAAKVGSGPYFAQGTDGSESTRLYFSLTALTTTGFGDLTPAAAAGRAIGVVEMLTGQLYLVTVIGVLVGGLVSRHGLTSESGRP
jgi:hypothetical protein